MRAAVDARGDAARGRAMCRSDLRQDHDVSTRPGGPRSHTIRRSKVPWTSPASLHYSKSEPDVATPVDAVAHDRGPPGSRRRRLEHESRGLERRNTGRIRTQFKARSVDVRWSGR